VTGFTPQGGPWTDFDLGHKSYLQPYLQLQTWLFPGT